jgi:hypothetical protein
MLTLKLIAIILILLCTSGVTHAAAVPAGSVVEGQTIAEWTAEWWKWAISIPVSSNPLLDTGGIFSGLGDVGGPVFFLAGSFSSGVTTRAFSVPSGKYILFPIINAFLSGEEEGTPDQMRARLDAYVASIDPDSLQARVDGVDLPNLSSHRETSPDFEFTLPDDNVFGVPDPTYGPSVSDGYWIMLEPLAPGDHTIQFGGSSSGVPGDLAFEDAFSLTVIYAPVPEPGSFALSIIAIGGLAFQLARRRFHRRN